MDPIQELRQTVEELRQTALQGFASVNDRFDALEGRMDRRFSSLDQDLAYVRRALLDHNTEFQEIRSVLDKKADRAEVEALVERR
ncbi:MAG TPA: hypothetical protein VF765_27475 [Polyangiaceae bacterium]